MTRAITDDLDRYFAEARQWDQDRLGDALRSRRLAWIAAGVATGLAITATSAVALLAPLKTVEPFVVRVDRSTGAVEVMRGLSDDDGPLHYDEVVSKYFLAQYVRTREAYLAPAAEDGFRLVALLSTPAEQGRWATFFRGSNPDSPQNQYGASGEAIIAIRAIAMIGDGVANVRFHRTERRGQALVESDWIATVAFRYSRAPLTESDRLRNPLGFQVSSYRADPEVIR
ncbi:virB8 family protein [Brevundimonas nasdae]|uniref:VirB8 family protein n=1 Tax=Brevundimonas nasdae TaxID=172043 RepID=A0ABX8TPV5_9CAUL|nr:virB8 family protein [Brevundimonas nasdae]QYC11459.1 virB8 family protein [Brevundimonas nasdae]QYC14247.1 virB8 family protein [Brevundimonas nasdae]